MKFHFAPSFVVQTKTNGWKELLCKFDNGVGGRKCVVGGMEKSGKSVSKLHPVCKL